MNPSARWERRRSRRWSGAECCWLTAARLRHGFEVDVINLSMGGALVEAATRLLPGASVELHLVAPGWNWSVAARILRCQVWRLLPEGAVRYRAGLQFDRPLQLPAAFSDEKAVDDERSPGRIADPRLARAVGINYPRPLRHAVRWEAATQFGRSWVPSKRKIGVSGSRSPWHRDW